MSDRRNLAPTALNRLLLERRALRQRRRRRQLHDIGQLLLLALASAALFQVLLQNWWLRDVTQIELIGSQLVTAERLLDSGGLSLPTSLFTLSPPQLEQHLIETLPLQRVRVERLLAPARLRLLMEDRIAVARAERQGPVGMETGFLDREGRWLSTADHRGLGASPLPTGLRVEGWSQRHRPLLLTLWKTLPRLDTPVASVRFSDSGALTLVTSGPLGMVRLGIIDHDLERKLQAMEHLHRQLSADRTRAAQPLAFADLSNPDQPELGLSSEPGTALPTGFSQR